MKTVNVEKKELLSVLKANKIQHIEDFKEVIEEYKLQIVEKAEELLEKAKAYPLTTRLYSNLSKPENHESDYTEAIAMLEMSTDETIVLDQREFKTYVLDEWSWANDFAMSKTAYKGR